MRPRRRLVLATCLTLAATVLTPAPSHADDSLAGPPSSASCLKVAGTTGILYVGGAVPSSGTLSGDRGFGAVAPADLDLPDRIAFKDDHHTFSDDYAFALRHGHLFVREATEGVGNSGTAWHRLRLPGCLAGHLTSVSADGTVLTAVGPERQLYSHDMPDGDLSPERWTWRWGPYFWTGSGIRLPADAPALATSELDSGETFTDTGGRRHHAIGVMTGYLLRGDRRTITYIDPWLPSDESREVCGPRRGSLPIASLDATGSTLFVATESGDLFTRLYDFDISGANYAFGDYTWERDVPPDSTAWQLPAPDWQRQPAPPGNITDRISIATTGPDAADRELRIEGRGPAGRTGIWHKQITAPAWRFTVTDDPLRGNAPDPDAPEAEPRDRTYLGEVAGRPASVRDFNHACSPATLRVRVSRGVSLRLRLHSEDALRQASRERGLNDQPRRYNAAIIVPDATWRRLDDADPRLQRFVAEHLDGQVTEVPITVTATRLRIEFKCWELTLNGDPARPDAPPPPDPGVLFGTLLDAAEEPGLPACPD